MPGSQAPLRARLDAACQLGTFAWLPSGEVRLDGTVPPFQPPCSCSTCCSLVHVLAFVRRTSRPSYDHVESLGLSSPSVPRTPFRVPAPLFVSLSACRESVPSTQALRDGVSRLDRVMINLLDVRDGFVLEDARVETEKMLDRPVDMVFHCQIDAGDGDGGGDLDNEEEEEEFAEDSDPAPEVIFEFVPNVFCFFRRLLLRSRHKRNAQMMQCSSRRFPSRV